MILRDGFDAFFLSGSTRNKYCYTRRRSPGVTLENEHITVKDGGYAT